MIGSTVKAVLIGLVCGLAYAQSTGARLEFEVASVKPSPPPEPGKGMRVGGRGGPGSPDPGRISYENMSLANLVSMAYDVRFYQLTAPDWANTTRFDVTAKVPEGATKEQFRTMMQNLLQDRFQLAVHREQKEMPVYELTVDKKGVKFQESAPDPPPGDGGPSAGSAAPRPDGPPKFTMGKDGFPELPGSGPGMIIMNGRARMRAVKQTMEAFTAQLSGQVGRPVTDATGLKGKYDFTIYWAAESIRPMAPGGLAPPPPPGGGAISPTVPEADADSGPSLFSALQTQLGLRLESKKGLVTVLVIDHAEKVPTEN